MLHGNLRINGSGAPPGVRKAGVCPDGVWFSVERCFSLNLSLNTPCSSPALYKPRGTNVPIKLHRSCGLPWAQGFPAATKSQHGHCPERVQGHGVHVAWGPHTSPWSSWARANFILFYGWESTQGDAQVPLWQLPKDRKALPARLPEDQLGAGTQWAAQAPQPPTLSPVPRPCSGLTPPRCLRPSLLDPGSCQWPPPVCSTPTPGSFRPPEPSIQPCLFPGRPLAFPSSTPWMPAPLAPVQPPGWGHGHSSVCQLLFSAVTPHHSPTWTAYRGQVTTPLRNFSYCLHL